MQWLPATEQELIDALADGRLREDHYTDMKRELSSNRELAKDVASFAIDGGRLILGVEEVPGSEFKPSPVPLAGLKEKVDQVARSIPDPPLRVRTIEIPASGGNGYLIVVVPVSAEAPHMVDGKYYGRSDTTRYVLPDAEVTRLHTLRVTREADASALLDAEIARDPTVGTPLYGCHLFIVAEPVQSKPEALLNAVPDHRLDRWVAQELLAGPAGARLSEGFEPDLTSLDFSRRAGGVGAHRYGVTADRRVSEDAKSHRLLDLEVLDSGGLRLFCGRASDVVGRQVHDEGVNAIFEVLIMGLTKRVVLAAATVSETMGFWGNWDFGVAVTEARGLISWEMYQRRLGMGATPYSADDYRQVARATVEEIKADPAGVVRALTGRLNRALNADTVSVPSLRDDVP